MYLPRHFEQADPAQIEALVRGAPLGTLIVASDEAGLVVNHVPFLWVGGALHAHVARANPVWSMLASARSSVVAFVGPQSYVTPNWYPTKAETGKVVPTWNYVVAHAHGRARAIEDPAWLLEHVTGATDFHERGDPSAWKVSDAPAAYIEQMLKGIVGVEFTVERWEAKWKVSQNRLEPDRRGVIAGLGARGDDQAREMAHQVAQALDKSPSR